MKQIGSEITGVVALEAQDAKRIGQLPGEIGSEKLPMIEAGEAAQWLAARKPSETDRALVSLVQQFGVKLREDRRPVYPIDGGFRSELVSVSGFGKALCDMEKMRVQQFLTPAPRGQLERWIAELSVVAVRRADDDMSEMLRLQAYVDRLRAYPADVARAALLDKTWPFFPSWHELKVECDALVGNRLKLIAAAKNPTPGPAPSKPLSAKEQIARQKAGEQDRTWTPKTAATPRGPLPYKPDPVAPKRTPADIRGELAALDADPSLASDDSAAAYRDHLLAELAQLEMMGGRHGQ